MSNPSKRKHLTTEWEKVGLKSPVGRTGDPTPSVLKKPTKRRKSAK